MSSETEKISKEKRVLSNVVQTESWWIRCRGERSQKVLCVVTVEEACKVNASTKGGEERHFVVAKKTATLPPDLSN